MTTSTPKDSPAFPSGMAVAPDGDIITSTDFEIDCGMTLRDYFAAKAMQGILSTTKIDLLDLDLIGKQAYYIAELMMRERDDEGNHS